MVALTTSAMLQARADDLPEFLNQGAGWTATTRADFYSRDQGSEMIPLAWIQALKQPNGQPFLDGSLSRYGYLPLPGSTTGLPVGFTTHTSDSKVTVIGMNCSACHTRQISVGGKEFRIDGGPGIVDFQAFLTDLDKAVADVRVSDATFLVFAKTVLGTANPGPAAVKDLRSTVDLWYLRFDTLMQHALPTPSWGPGRLDAVSMIFNRVTGLDIGPAPSFLIADNIKPADAPVRYPFLWNAAIQDFTQWPGFAENGSDLLGLVRNLGEVYGVFGVFQPKRVWLLPVIIDFLNHNSADFQGLLHLEDLIKQIGPPQYPWKVDAALADKGKAIFNLPNDQGGCVACHGITPGKTRLINNKTWTTPIMDVGTDSREYQVLARTVATGVYKGFGVPDTRYQIKATEKSFDILAISVVGSIGQEALRTTAFLNAVVHEDVQAIAANWSVKSLTKDLATQSIPPELEDLKGAYRGSVFDSGANQLLTTFKSKGTPPAAPTAAPTFAYESRVMQGIWAAAPYLHDGSVPTLADLLEPVAKRPTSFVIGPNYDIDRIGIAKDQTKFTQVLQTGCTDRASGSSNCGHEFGTGLSDDDKKALLEYLKIL